MPLKKTSLGGICPLEKFGFNYPGSHFGGGYDSDPVEACLNCNFSDLEIGEFDLDAICQCPSDMTKEKYKDLRNSYAKQGKLGERLTKKGFRDFVKQNR
jgi:hypothetical protein